MKFTFNLSVCSYQILSIWKDDSSKNLAIKLQEGECEIKLKYCWHNLFSSHECERIWCTES